MFNIKLGVGINIVPVIILVSFIGACLGSYVPTILYRHKKGMAMKINDRSKCENCGKVLGIKELVPVIGYILLQGESRCCNYKIPMKYPLIELCFAFIFGLITVLVKIVLGM